MRDIAVLSAEAGKYSDRLSESFDVIFLPRDTRLDGPVSAHPDMIMCALGKKLFVPAEYLKDNGDIVAEIAKRCGFDLTAASGERYARYPYDISLNVLVGDKCIFSLTEHTSPEIVSEAERLCLKTVRVRQGYAACSSLVAGDLMISADRGILAAAAENGYDTLEITPGHIGLKGYAHGFIGGASGVFGDKVYFAGALSSHPDEKKIRESLGSHGFGIIELDDGTLTDIGGIKLFSSVTAR